MANIVNSIVIHWRPQLDLTIDYTATRNGGEKSDKVQYNFSFSYVMMSSGGYFGTSNSIGLRFNVDGTSHIAYLQGNGSGNSYGTLSFETTNKSSTGKSDATIDVWCHQGSFAEPTGESNNCTAGSSNTPNYFGQTRAPYGGTITGIVLSYPAYNPYTPSSIWLNGDASTKIGRLRSK